MSKTVNDSEDLLGEEAECRRCSCPLCGGTGVDPDDHMGYTDCDCTYYSGNHTTGSKCLYVDIYGDRLKPVEVVLKQDMGVPGWYLMKYVFPLRSLIDDDEE